MTFQVPPQTDVYWPTGLLRKWTSDQVLRFW